MINSDSVGPIPLADTSRLLLVANTEVYPIPVSAVVADKAGRVGDTVASGVSV